MIRALAQPLEYRGQAILLQNDEDESSGDSASHTLAYRRARETLTMTLGRHDRESPDIFWQCEQALDDFVLQ